MPRKCGKPLTATGTRRRSCRRGRQATQSRRPRRLLQSSTRQLKTPQEQLSLLQSSSGERPATQSRRPRRLLQSSTTQLQPAQEQLNLLQSSSEERPATQSSRPRRLPRSNTRQLKPPQEQLSLLQSSSGERPATQSRRPRRLLRSNTTQLNPPQEQLSLLQSSSGEHPPLLQSSCPKTDARPQVCLHALRCASCCRPRTLTGNIYPYQRIFSLRATSVWRWAAATLSRVNGKHQPRPRSEPWQTQPRRFAGLRKLRRCHEAPPWPQAY